ncbi:MAG: hypothetical protein R2839_03480 [Thermomicrobiales bacterium]
MNWFVDRKLAFGNCRWFEIVEDHQQCVDGKQCVVSNSGDDPIERSAPDSAGASKSLQKQDRHHRRLIPLLGVLQVESRRHPLTVFELIDYVVPRDTQDNRIQRFWTSDLACVDLLPSLGPDLLNEIFFVSAADWKAVFCCRCSLSINTHKSGCIGSRTENPVDVTRRKGSQFPKSSLVAGSNTVMEFPAVGGPKCVQYLSFAEFFNRVIESTPGKSLSSIFDDFVLYVVVRPPARTSERYGVGIGKYPSKQQLPVDAYSRIRCLFTGGVNSRSIRMSHNAT